MKADFFCNRCFKHLPIKELGAKGKIHNMRYCKLCTAIADKRRAVAAKKDKIELPERVNTERLNKRLAGVKIRKDERAFDAELAKIEQEFNNYD